MYYFPDEQLVKLKTLLNASAIEILSKQGGGNSAVYCILADEKKYALKSYPAYAPDQRDRLKAELTVYQFLKAHQIETVPSLITHSESERWLIIDWIEGKIPEAYAATDIEQAINFIASMHALTASPEAAALPEAAQACLSLSILLNQISERLQRLQTIAKEEPDLHAFLSKKFTPVFEAYKEKVRHLDQDALLSQNKRSLIPADFGFHNAIRDANGRLHFFDFDYFGWDDPVKLLADILWHPKMQLTVNEQQQFVQGLTNVYSNDAAFLSRFYYTLPLFGLRWVLILLNEFIPACWQNRQHANAHQDQGQAKKIQLKRANDLLLKIAERVSNEAVSATSL